MGLALVRFQALGQAEVRDLGDAVGAEEDVGRFEVAVEDAGLMGRLHRQDERDHPLGRLLGWQHLPHQATDQATSFQQLECHVRGAVVLADVVDLEDIGVPQHGHGFGLDLEAGDLDFVGMRPADHLQGDDPVQPTMAGLVDDSHSAPAELTADFVVWRFVGCPGGRGGNRIRQASPRQGTMLAAKIGGHVRMRGGGRFREGRQMGVGPQSEPEASRRRAV